MRDLHPDRIQDGRATLEVLEGPDAGLVYSIEPHGEAEIGRDAGCAFRLADPRVDPRHVRVRSNGREVILFHLGGPGGLLVGGQSMEYRILAPGDEFRIGGTRIVVRAGTACGSEASRRARTQVFLERAEKNLPTAAGRIAGGWPGRPRFGEIALAQGLVDSATLARAVAFQEAARAAGRPVRLGEAFTSQGALSAEHVDLVLQIQRELEDLGEIRGYPYRRLLGAGSAGFVFEAVSQETGQAVALKIIRPELLSREEAVKRFLRESRILLDLDHPNLVRGLEVGFSDGLYFLAMEYVAGRSLRRRIESEGSVP
ncbi:MAG: protein kinase, partial [Planctomycetes bacterium]|nr:protein kinase [Planctomycetota bacterium]